MFSKKCVKSFKPWVIDQKIVMQHEIQTKCISPEDGKLVEPIAK